MQLTKIFTPYLEAERHSIMHMCLKQYSSRRKGVHAYMKSNAISGYYESGKVTRNGNLFTAKSWFFLSAKECEETVKVKWIIFPEPMLLFVYWAVIVGCAIRFILDPSVETTIEFLIGGGMALVLLQSLLSDAVALDTALKNILSDASLSNE